MANNKPKSQPSKPVHINLDVFPEDNTLLNTIQSEQQLNSKKESFHIICNSYRGEDEQETSQLQCEYLCGGYCAKNGAEKIRKVDVSYCQACQKSTKITDTEIEKNREYLANALWRRKVQCEIFIKIGIQRRDISVYNEDACLSMTNQLLDKRLSELASLETDNAFLREQLTTLQKDPLTEKNAWLTVEVSKRDEEIKKLKAENEQKDAVIRNYMFHQQGITK